MRAVVLGEPGPPEALRLKERPVPVPAVGEVLVRVHACGVCYHDVVVRAGLLRRGIRFPLVLGHELAGEVVATGPGVARLKTGDRVAAIPSALGHYRDG